MADAAEKNEQPTPPPPVRLSQREVRRNFSLGVLNGAFFNLVTAFISPTLVLALFVSRLGGGNILVGLIPAITTGSYLLPQLFVAGRAQAQPLVMRWYATSGVIRITSFVLITLSTLFLAGDAANYALLLLLFYLFYIVTSLAAGVSAIPWIAMVGKVIPPRRRGLFFGLRNFSGGLLALAASGIIKLLLDEGNRPGSPIAFPLNFAIIFAITTVLIIGGIISWVLIREPAQTSVPQPLSVLQMLRRGPGNLRADRNYRYFLLARILLALSAIADPFYIVYATRSLGAADSIAALYIAALTIASIFSNLIWSPLADFGGNRRMMILTALSVAVVPTSALLIPLLVSGQGVATAFAVVFIFSGIAAGAANIVNLNVLLNIAPAARRSEYIGYLNTILGIFTFFPVLGGSLIDWVGYQFVFILATVFGFLALLSSFSLSRGKIEE